MNVTEVPGKLAHVTWETGKWMHRHPKWSFFGATALCGFLSFGGFHASGDMSNSEAAWTTQAQNTTLIVDNYQYAAQEVGSEVKKDKKEHDIDKVVKDQAREITLLTQATQLGSQVNYAEDQARAISAEREDWITFGIGNADAAGLFAALLVIKAVIDWGDRDYRRLNG